MRLKLMLMLAAVGFLCIASDANAQTRRSGQRIQSSSGGSVHPWPYHTDQRRYNHYVRDESIPAYRHGDTIWYAYKPEGQIIGSPYEGQTAWSDDTSHAYKRMWRVHHTHVEQKLAWAHLSDGGALGYSYQEPKDKTGLYPISLTMKDSRVTAYKWVGETPNWPKAVLARIIDEDTLQPLPHWAMAEKVGWNSGAGYDYFGDNEDGTVNRYSRQAEAPVGGYQAMDNTRWTPFVPNGSTEYGNVNSSRPAAHRAPYLWEIRGAGKPQTKRVTIYKPEGYNPSVNYTAATTEHGGYPATIVQVGQAIRSIKFDGNEPWPGAAAEIVRLYGNPPSLSW